MVILTDECPRISESVLLSIPISIQREANACRREWILIFGISHCSRSRLNLRWIVRGSIHFRFVPVRRYASWSVAIDFNFSNKKSEIGISLIDEGDFGGPINRIVLGSLSAPAVWSRFFTREIVRLMWRILCSKSISSHVFH